MWIGIKYYFIFVDDPTESSVIRIKKCSECIVEFYKYAIFEHERSASVEKHES